MAIPGMIGYNFRQMLPTIYVTPVPAWQRSIFSMTQAVRSDPALNWMFAPSPVSPACRPSFRSRDIERTGIPHQKRRKGLVASADREGFVDNRAFTQMQDLVRGSVEAIAYVDRELQLKEEEAQRQQLVDTLQDQTRAAIAEIQANPDIAAAHKARIVSALAKTSQMAEFQRETSREREQQLGVMSLLGVVAGFMDS